MIPPLPHPPGRPHVAHLPSNPTDHAFTLHPSHTLLSSLPLPPWSPALPSLGPASSPSHHTLRPSALTQVPLHLVTLQAWLIQPTCRVRP